MNNKYTYLFSPINIKGRIFKNRIFAAPSSCHNLTSGTCPNDDVIAYFAEKAKGGTAAITFSGQNMDIDRPEDVVHAGDDIFDVANRKSWLKLTEAVHFYDTYIGLELLQFHHHGYNEKGELINYSVDGSTIETAESMEGDSLIQPQLPLSEMEKIAGRYADAAEAALLCGFDYIMIHGGHGVLLSQFISPLYNHRTDEFGGSACNRARFPLMILKAIRERVGDKLLIEYRLSGDELAGEDGFTIDDCIDFLKRIQDYIDIAHVSAGGFMSRTEHITHPGIFCEEGCNVKYAEAVKKCPDINIPVLTLGALQMPKMMDEIIRDGKADLISMARGTIADPYMPQKALEGNEDDIIPCLRCMRCSDFVTKKYFGCSVNPRTGRELKLKRLVDDDKIHSLLVSSGLEKKKKVAVIGGGPAGMEAAVTAKRRGADVVIFDKNETLGGKLLTVSQPPFKAAVKAFMEYQIRTVNKLGIEVRSGSIVTPEVIKGMGFDAVIAAIGARPVIPPIEGAKLDHVMTAKKLYEMIDTTEADNTDMTKSAGNNGAGVLRGRKIVIIGGGEIGCESAVYIYDKLGVKPVILEMKDTLADGANQLSKDALYEQLETKAVCYTSVCVNKITESGVIFTDKDGKEQLEQADYVLISCGMKPSGKAESFRNCADEFFVIGDAAEAANIEHAVRTGYDAAVRI